MHKVIAYSIGALVLFSSAIQEVRAEEAPKKNIAAILPFTGAVAGLGQSCRAAMEMAKESLPPEERDKINFIFEDDGNQAGRTVSSYKKLSSVNPLFAVVTLASNTSNAITSLVNKDKIVQLAVASDPQVSKAGPYSFTLWVTPETEAEKTVEEALRRSYKKIAMISAIHEGTLAVENAVTKAFDGKLEVVAKEQIASDSQDFRSSILRMKAASEKAGGIDAIYANLFFAQAGIFAKQVRELGIQAPFFSIETFEDEEQVKLAQGALNDQWYVSAGEGQSNFVESFQKLHPEKPLTCAANCYDAVLLLAKLPAKTPEEFRQQLFDLKDFKAGALGQYSSTKDNRFSLPAIVKTIRVEGDKVEFIPQVEKK